MVHRVLLYKIFIVGPSTPQNLSTQSLNSTAILVSWDHPTNPNGKIKYRLSFSTGSSQVASFKLVYDGESTQYMVSNLKPFTQYSFKVNAYNVKYNLSSPSAVAMETTAQTGKFVVWYEGLPPPISCFKFYYVEPVHYFITFH